MRAYQFLAALALLSTAGPALAQDLPRATCTATRGLVCEKGDCQPRAETLDLAITTGARDVRLCMRRGSQEICANLDALDITAYPTTGTATARLVYRDGAQLLGNATYMMDVGVSAGLVVTALRGGSVVITTGTCVPAG